MLGGRRRRRGDRRRRPARRGRRPAAARTARRSRRRSSRSARSTRSGTGSCTAARCTPRRCWSPARCGSGSSRSPTWRRCTSPSRSPPWTPSAAVLPDTPAVACFDTAFHATIPAAAATFALPAEWRTRWTLRRYGFHGLSHAYASRRAAELAGRRLRRDELRVVTCHLGAGASLAAVHGGRSVDTTMGFTPLDGLVMATQVRLGRPGSRAVARGARAHAAARARGHPGEPLRPARPGRAPATCARCCPAPPRAMSGRCSAGTSTCTGSARPIAAMAAAMDGLDVLVFTGGVGENSPEIRSRAAAGLGFLGVAVDESRNARQADAAATTGRSPPRARGSARSSSPPARTSRSPPRSARSWAESVESLVEYRFAAIKRHWPIGRDLVMLLGSSRAGWTQHGVAHVSRGNGSCPDFHRGLRVRDVFRC